MTNTTSVANAALGGLGAEPPTSLDSIKHYRNTLPPAPESERLPKARRWGCGKWTMVGVSDNGTVKHSRHYCKSYGCGRCAPRKRKRLRRRLVELAQQFKLCRMVTLTLDPKSIPTGTDSIRYIRGEVWRKMRVYLSRRFGGSVAYIAVLELHQSGIAHLHVLIDTYIPQAWLVRSWHALGGGKICRIQLVGVRNVAAYLSKYLSKEQELPAGVRHVTTSRGLTIWPEAHSQAQKDVRWALVRAPIDLFHQRAKSTREERFETEENGALVLVWFVSDSVPLEFGRA